MLNPWFALPVAAILAGLGLHFIGLKVLRARYRQKQLGLSPSDDSLLAPGRSLLLKIDRVTIELKAHRLCVLIQPVLLIAVIFLYRTFNPELDLQFLITSLVACGLVFLYCLWNLIQGLKSRRRHRLSYDAEVEVGQALDQLVSQGYHVFHDVAEDTFNIDHVVVGPKGVFSVVTKARSKLAGKGRTADATVSYNGHVLFFPDWTDEETVSQAVRQADLLSKWLDSAAGELISARAVVAIPGWYVKRTTSEGVPVVNPTQFPSLFEHITSRPLTDSQIDRIVGQLNLKGRNGIDA